MEWRTIRVSCACNCHFHVGPRKRAKPARVTFAPRRRHNRNLLVLNAIIDTFLVFMRPLGLGNVVRFRAEIDRRNVARRSNQARKRECFNEACLECCSQVEDSRARVPLRPIPRAASHNMHQGRTKCLQVQFLTGASRPRGDSVAILEREKPPRRAAFRI